MASKTSGFPHKKQIECFWCVIMFYERAEAELANLIKCWKNTFVPYDELSFYQTKYKATICNPYTNASDVKLHGQIYNLCKKKKIEITVQCKYRSTAPLAGWIKLKQYSSSCIPFGNNSPWLFFLLLWSYYISLFVFIFF